MDPDLTGIHPSFHATLKDNKTVKLVDKLSKSGYTVEKISGVDSVWIKSTKHINCTDSSAYNIINGKIESKYKVGAGYCDICHYANA